MQTTSRPPVLGVAIAGIGRIGRRHARLAEASARSRLAAVYDPDASARAAGAAIGTDVAEFESWDDLLLAPEVDVVVIATPPAARSELCVRAVEAGKAVLLEKPIALTADECDYLRKVGEGAVIQVAHHSRHSWDLQRARERVAAGAIGRVVSVTVTGRARRIFRAGSWYFDPDQGGGVVLESLGHSVDLVRWLLDAEFQGLTAEYVVGEASDQQFDHTVAVVGSLDSGALVSMLASFGGPPTVGLHQRVEIIGTEGVLDFELGRRPVQFSSALTDGLLVDENPDREEAQFGALGRQWDAFLDAAEGLREASPGLTDALETMSVVFAAQRSALDGRRVMLAGDDGNDGISGC
jgi:predicted dehydrogenase